MFKIIKKYGININLNDDDSSIASDTNELETAIETFDNLINKHSLFHIIHHCYLIKVRF